MSDSRLFKILYYLLDKGRSTAPELAAKFEVSTRTIYRDVDALSSAGIPICAESGRKGGIYLMDDFVLDKTLLSGQDKEDILTTLQSMSATGLSMQTALLTKLSALFNGNGNANSNNNTGDTAAVPNYDWLEVDFSRWENHPYDNPRFETLKKAIVHHNIIKIAYHDPDGKKSERKVKPIKLSYKSKDWYLKAFCLEKQDIRIFKCNRITDIELLDETFEPISYQKEEDDSDVCHKVVLLFAKKAAGRVYDEFEESQIEQKANGDLLVTANMPVDAWLVSYVLSFGPQVELVEPKYLQKLLARQAQTVYEKYK